MNLNMIKTLKLQLKDFGLSPNDWILEIKESKLGLIKHKFQSDFEFLGRYTNENGKITWKSLELYRI